MTSDRAPGDRGVPVVKSLIGAGSGEVGARSAFADALGSLGYGRGRILMVRKHRVLVIDAGRVLTHRELLARASGPASASDTQYLHVFISQLRRKLELDPAVSRHILTESGVGYQFSAER
jgi:hypothetical protein